MKKLLKIIIINIYHDIISPHFQLAVFILTYALSYPFLSYYHAGLSFLLSIIVTCVFSLLFKKYL
ncbi:hypothetical protein G842_02042 [Escherichia coli HVH 190 (4-3255514)]|nr:hypothetical protein G842_02042 [Escherichia coli HVH 190 (4-3255514)]EQX02721.1 hypothetical protein G921_04333 [Escherichia coli UMEA 3155-1]GCW61178.1 hypothetical protein HmCmsJML116_03778 [Escherichia coli]GDB46545.1 hypothetical protein HmCmsJML188_02438 [Escherichia coli]